MQYGLGVNNALVMQAVCTGAGFRPRDTGLLPPQPPMKAKLVLIQAVPLLVFALSHLLL
jgi:hypothetical protein